MGRHAAGPPRWRLLTLAAADAVLATAAIAMLASQADVQPAAAPSVAAAPTDRADDSGARAGRYQRPVTPTIVPPDAPVWEPAKGPVIVDGQPLKRTTVAPRRAVRTKAPPPQPPPPPATSEAEPAPPTVGLPPVVEPVTPVDDAQPAEPPVAEQPPDTPADILDELTDPEPTQQPAQEPTP